MDERQKHLWRACFAMRRYLDKAIEEQLAEHGLSHADQTVLVALSEVEGRAVRVRDLGERISWEGSRWRTTCAGWRAAG